MDTLFGQLKKLYDNELYDQVQPVVSNSIDKKSYESEKIPAPNKAKHLSN